jgi:hypothetical protein
MSFAAASTQQNTVTAKLGSDGAVSVRNNAGSAVQLVADVVGYYAAGPAVPGGYRPVRLHRIFDTRATGSHPLASGATASVPVTGRGAVPASNVSAGAINLTVLSPAGTGSVSVFPAAAIDAVEIRPMLIGYAIHPSPSLPRHGTPGRQLVSTGGR